MPSKSGHPLGPQPAAYVRLLAQLAQAGWISQGTVVCRSLRRRSGAKWVMKGPYYLWTGKRQGKTVCYALSKTQYAAAKKAIEANQRLMKTLNKLQAMTLAHILKKLTGVEKRKERPMRKLHSNFVPFA